MTKKHQLKIAVLSLSALAFVSCKKDDKSAATGDMMRFTATIDNGGAKTVINGVIKKSQICTLYTQVFNHLTDVFEHSRGLPFFGGSDFFVFREVVENLFVGIVPVQALPHDVAFHP